MNNPIKYPDYEENGVAILSVDANDLLIALYKIYATKKKDGTLYDHRFLIDDLEEIEEKLNFHHLQAMSAIKELKDHNLVKAVAASNTYLYISLESKAIAFYDRAVGRSVQQLLEKGLSLFL